MLTKAYIQDILSPHAVQIRIPLYNKIEGVEGATPNSELAIACVCTLPNFITNVQAGDIVIVGFEEDNISKPVILGYLSTSNVLTALTDVTCNQLITKGDTTLDEHTTIGEVKPESIKCLKNLKDNVSATFEATSKELQLIHEDISDLADEILENATSIGKIRDTDLTDIRGTIGSVIDRVKTLEDNYDALLLTLKEYVMKYPFSLARDNSQPVSYGKSLPTDAQPGQVYFTLKEENK